MRLHLPVVALVALLLLFFVPVAESAVTDRVSEAGEKLRIVPQVRSTTDAVKYRLLKGDSKQARDSYERAIMSDSTYAPARYALAKMLLYERADSAMMHARSAYLSDTTNHWYLDVYAQSLVGVERFDEAMPLFRRLIKLNPRDLNAYRVLAILLNMKGQPIEAIAVLDTAELRAGGHNFLTALKRQLLISTNQIDRAMSETKAMVEQAPYSAESRVAMAELYSAIKSDSLAQSEFDAAMRIDSTRIETLIAYGSFLESRSRQADYLDVLRMVMKSGSLDFSDKITLLMEVVSDDKLYRREYIRVGDLIRTLLIQAPKNQVLVEMQARHLISLGLVDDAAEYLKGHLDDTPPVMSYFRTVIDLERYMNRLDSADHYLLRASKRFPEDIDLRFERGYLLSSQQRYDEAIECYEQEMKSAPDSLRSSISGIIGDIHYQRFLQSRDSLGEKRASKYLKLCYKYYDRALKLDPNNSMVLNNYAYFLSERDGNLHKAYDMSKRAVEMTQNNPTFLDTYAWVLYRMGRFADAKIVMRQAISFDRTENGEIALHYGEILSVLGESTMANFYWEKAISWGMSEEQVAESRERAKQMMEMEDLSDSVADKKE